MKAFFPSMACLLVLVAGHAAAQSVYKWTDAQGTVHYTDQPPPSGSKATTVKLRGGSEVSSGTMPPAQSAPAAAGTSASSSPLARAEASARAANCERAKENLTTLASGALLVDSTDPSTAKRLQPYQVEDAKRAAQGEVTTYCGPAGK
jgi:hypothetical protein